MARIKNENGKLDAIAFPGGYSVLYVCKDASIVCADCANTRLSEGAEAWEGEEPTAAFLHWEGPPEFCANCNAEITSEYGDPEQE